MFQIMLNLHLIFVNITHFRIRLFVDFSFDSENGSIRIISFRSSNNHLGIIESFLSLLKYSILFLIKFLGNPADKNLFVMRFTSKFKIVSSPFSSMHFSRYGITFLSGWNFWRPMQWKLFRLTLNLCFYFRPTSNDVGIYEFRRVLFNRKFYVPMIRV